MIHPWVRVVVLGLLIVMIVISSNDQTSQNAPGYPMC